MMNTVPLLLASTLYAATVTAQGDILGTATVNAAIARGTPSHLASGILYGIPDAQGQIPSEFYTDMGFNYGRGGGSRLPSPALGWVYGETQFENRFASALSNYQTARSYGAPFQLLVADLWGADQTSVVPLPGDDGNWTSYDLFLDALFEALTDNEMTEALDFEIWNEPDTAFEANLTQFYDMWARGYRRVKEAFPDMPIIGPCSASRPYVGESFWAEFLAFVAADGTEPQLYCWHEESSSYDIATDLEDFNATLAYYGASYSPVNINEYATEDEQVPGAIVWYVSRLERYDTQGLRGNWAIGYSLHDYLANLLGKPGATEDCTDADTCAVSTGYWGNGEFDVYRYYNLNMTGERLATTGSPDALFDIYATSDGTTVRMLCGSRLTAGTWDIAVTNLAALGLPDSGTIVIQSYQFNWPNGVFGDVPSPVNQGTYPHDYSDGTLVFYVSPNETTAYAFEFTI
ncbi:hypothetical protein ASPZODRAFT_147101 [Penicilliopsis zonata CBS 506.65]|uniref:Glycoside hydrolase family 39 protein n=1 Tax=Penicilliopsis zonata CBS 506.65 TaxID=1073090 RepID=A0A1L9S6B0_9EURO|nr:hypothetical protein ASPZODRAFT_147101 [Penicilliopsis zonata CBS 506.65]OJJ42690.1 hypothetical protein ASPZODRAFT_147101 [Penicilliopsis zonata CBS 506.65]